MAIVTCKYCTISVCCTLFVVILATTVRTSFGEGRKYIVQSESLTVGRYVVIRFLSVNFNFIAELNFF